jgi:glyoxylase-like metal-dependent hydrolase (beta-lactamase superfamily II)
VERPRTIARGVELFPARTPTLPPATHTNSYALGDREVVLVEPATPYDDERAAWLDWARGFERAGRRVQAIVLTHHHADHVGGAALFARELGVPLWAHANTAALLPDLPIARHLDEGDVIELDGGVKLRVLFTPGHARGHVCLLDEAAGVIVVGDMVASEGTILIEPDGGDMQRYLVELERLALLDAAIALPAHGAPIGAPTALFRGYVAHRLAREAKALAALRDQPRPVDDLVLEVYADTPAALHPIASLSLEAHLVKLEREGAARRAETGWARA